MPVRQRQEAQEVLWKGLSFRTRIADSAKQPAGSADIWMKLEPASSRCALTFYAVL